MINSKEERQKKLICVFVVIFLIASTVSRILGICISHYSDPFRAYGDIIFGCVLFFSKLLFLLAVIMRNKYKSLFISSAVFYLIYNCGILGERIVIESYTMFYDIYGIINTLYEFIMIVFAVILLVGVIRWCFDKKYFKVLLSIFAAFVIIIMIINVISLYANDAYEKFYGDTLDGRRYYMSYCAHCVSMIMYHLLYLGSLFLFYVGYPMKNIFLKKNSYLAKSDIDIQYALEILKSKYESGKISPEEYTRAKREVLDKML